MNEKDIHKLIEQQDSEAKQRIWEKVLSQMSDVSLQIPNAEKHNSNKGCKANRGKQDMSD